MIKISEFFACARQSNLAKGLFRLDALVVAFVLFVAPMGVFLASLQPPGLVADEIGHFVRVEAVLHGSLVGSRRYELGKPDVLNGAGVRGDSSIFRSVVWPDQILDATLYHKIHENKWVNAMNFLEVTPLAIYFPVFYLPAAGGAGLMKLVGGSPLQSLYAGRFVNLSIFLGLGLAAISIARRGRATIFLTLAMPMGLSLGASLNPDGLLIATAALAAAFWSRRSWISAAVCLGLVILVKPPYAPLALILMMPVAGAGAGQTPGILRRMGRVFLTVAPGLIWFGYTMAAISAPTARAAYAPGPLWSGDPTVLFLGTDPAAQISVILHRPLAYLHMMWSSITDDPNLGIETIGVLGSLNFILSPAIYFVWTCAAWGAIASDVLGQTHSDARWRDAVLVSVIIVLMLAIIWTSQYVNWTNVGADRIEGPSGRYLLPLIPLIGLVLPSIRFRRQGVLRGALLGLPIAASAATLVLLPPLLVIHFYLR